MSVAGVHSDHSASTSALVGDDIRSCARAEACGCSAVEVFITSIHGRALSWRAKFTGNGMLEAWRGERHPLRRPRHPVGRHPAKCSLRVAMRCLCNPCGRWRDVYIAGVGFQSGEVVVLQLAESEAFQLLMRLSLPTLTPRSRSRALSSVVFFTAAGGVYHSLVRRLWCRWFILNKLHFRNNNNNNNKNRCPPHNTPNTYKGALEADDLG